MALVDKPLPSPASAVKADARALTPGAPTNLKIKDSSPVAVAQKDPDSLTGQLADSLMDVFKTFTGR